MSSEETIDQLDLLILMDLLNDGRIPFRKIAEHHQISIGTVHNRIKKMKKSGIIQRFSLNIHSQGLGMKIEIIALFDVESQHIDDFVEFLREFKFIQRLMKTTGTNNYILNARFKEMNDLTQFAKRINNIKGVKSNINIVLETPIENSLEFEMSLIQSLYNNVK